MEKIKALLNDKARRKEVILYLVFGILTTLVNLLVYGGLILLVHE
jgi:putative flippase GtrA